MSSLIITQLILIKPDVWNPNSLELSAMAGQFILEEQEKNKTIDELIFLCFIYPKYQQCRNAYYIYLYWYGS